MFWLLFDLDERKKIMNEWFFWLAFTTGLIWFRGQFWHKCFQPPPDRNE
jgi:hypothetical protein